LEKNGIPFYLEVKSVTLVEDGVAMFPDAVTERGTRHMTALSELVKSGNDAGVLFVCQRSDVNSFRPQCERDPKFAESLKSAEKTGVRIHVIKAKVTPESIKYMGEIPYNLN
jgi:sugar fermentation stimulation protein A